MKVLKHQQFQLTSKGAHNSFYFKIIIVLIVPTKNVVKYRAIITKVVIPASSSNLINYSAKHIINNFMY